MSKEAIKNIIYVVLIMGIFILILVETSKSNRGYTFSDYAQYEAKYEGKVNQINYVKVSDLTMAQKYLSDFVNICLTNKKEAYELIDPYYKEKEMKNYNTFSAKVDEMNTKVFAQSKVASYKVSSGKNYRYYYVKDAADNVYVFKENGIMNYTVYLDMTNLDF